MRTFVFISALVMSQFLGADSDEDADAEFQEYLAFLSLYDQVIGMTFNCQSSLHEIEFMYTEDYRRYNKEHYFSITPDRFCFIEAEESSIHDQVYHANKSGLTNVEDIFNSIKYSKYEMQTNDCAGLEKQYKGFYEVVNGSINDIKKENTATLDPVESEDAEFDRITIRIHPPIYDFSFGDYMQPEVNIRVSGSDHALVEWAYKTKEIADSCKNQ